MIKDACFGLVENKFSSSIIGDAKLEFPPIVVNSVIRIHGIMSENFNGHLTFRVYDPRAVTTFVEPKNGIGEIGNPKWYIFFQS